MVFDYFDKLTFLCEMYDKDADRIIELILIFFPFDNSCQVINAKEKTNLVKRVQVPSLRLEMLQIGNTVKIFSKLLLITDCAPATKQELFKNTQSTFALIKPMPAKMHGKIIAFIMKKGFRIVRMKNGRVDKDFAMSLYQETCDNEFLPIVVNYITGGEVIGLELVAPNAVTEWRRWLGVTNPKEAAQGTLRQIYGINKLENAAHGTHTRRDADKILELFFGRTKHNMIRFPFSATFENCTCCIIKPHAVIDGNVGPILERISSSEKFVISAMAMFAVNMTNAFEFYEVYKGVVPEYMAACIQLTEGKCITLEVKCIDPSLNCVSEFRKLCGPRDPDVCRQLYPDCIRALYGKDTVHNAVHCTDLPEDGVNEVEYFFRLLANA